MPNREQTWVRIILRGFLCRTWRQSSHNSLGLSSNETMNHRAMFGVNLWAVLPIIPEIPRYKSYYVNNNNYVNRVNGKKHSVVRFKQGYVSKPPEPRRPKFVFRRSQRQRLLFSVKLYQCQACQVLDLFQDSHVFFFFDLFAFHMCLTTQMNSLKQILVMESL